MMGVVEEVAVTEDDHATLAVVVAKSATNATVLVTLLGSAVRRTAVTSVTVWVTSPETAAEHQTNLCAITAARLDILHGNVLRVAARAKPVTTVESKDTLVVNALTPRMTEKMTVVVLTKDQRYTSTDHYNYFLLVHINDDDDSAYTKSKTREKMVLLFFILPHHKKPSIKSTFP
jgi:hypothetical protein